MCKPLIVLHTGNSARFCGGCSRSLDSVRFIYRPAKGLHSEPSPRCCGQKCVETVMTMYHARQERRAAVNKRHHDYNKTS